MPALSYGGAVMLCRIPACADSTANFDPANDAIARAAEANTGRPLSQPDSATASDSVTAVNAICSASRA
jgi:hypothetical protein